MKRARCDGRRLILRAGKRFGRRPTLIVGSTTYDTPAVQNWPRRVCLSTMLDMMGHVSTAMLFHFWAIPKVSPAVSKPANENQP
jgi:hypothetical protein